MIPNPLTPIGVINILGVWHTIATVNPESVGLSSNALGRWVESECRILINEKLKEPQQMVTIWHESTHALLQAIGESSLSQNEDFVEKLSRALFQIADLKIEYVKTEGNQEL